MATETTTLILELGAKLDKYNREIKTAMDKTETGAKRGQKSLKEVENASESLRRIGSRALLAFAGVAATTFASGKVVEYADSYTNLQNRIKTVLDPTQDLASVTADLLKVSNDTRSSLESTSILYARLKRNTKDLSLSNEELLNVTKTINQSFAVSGASAQEAQAAIIQLSQGLASGTLRGDEFNSVAEQAPVILEAVSAATGIARKDLRELAADGQISSETLIKSLQAYSKIIDNDFNKANMTAAQAQERLNNNFTIFVGELDKSLDITGGTVGTLENLSDALTLIQQPLLDTIEFFKDLNGIIGKEFEEQVEDFRAMSGGFQEELGFMKELFNAFVFSLQTGILVIPKLAKAAVEGTIAGIAALFEKAQLGILKFRRWANELLGDDEAVKALDAQIAALGDNAGAAFEATIEKIKEEMSSLKDIAAEFDAKMAEERLQRRKDADEKELEQLRERLEKEKQIREEFKNELAGTVKTGDSEDEDPFGFFNFKKNNKLIKKDKKMRQDAVKDLLKIQETSRKEGKRMDEAAFDFVRQKASASILAYAAEGAEKVISQLGLPGVPIAAGIIAAGGALANKVGGLSIGGGDGGISGGAPTAAQPVVNTADLEAEETSSLDLSVAGAGGDGTQIVFKTEDADSFMEALVDMLNGAAKRGDLRT